MKCSKQDMIHRHVIAALVSSGFAAGAAQAAIVHVPLNTPITPGQTHWLEYDHPVDYYFLRLELDYRPATQVASVALAEIVGPAGNPGSYDFVVDEPGGALRNVAPGALIGRPHSRYGGFAVANGIPAAEPFVFIAGIESLNYSDEPRNAWVRISWSPASGLFTLVDMAYETDAAVPIPAGQIPAPGAAALLALGAITLRSRRS